MSATITNYDGKKRDWLGVEDSEAEEDVGSEEDESRVKGISRASKRRKADHFSEEEDTNEKDKKEEAGYNIEEGLKGKGKGKPNNMDDGENDGENDDELLFTNPNKLKPLTQAELAASKLATCKTGVIYLSRIPVYALSTLMLGPSG